MPLSQTSTSTSSATATSTATKSASTDNGKLNGGDSGSKNAEAVGLVVGLGVGIPLAAAIATGVFVYLWRSKRRDKQMRLEGNPGGMSSSHGPSSVPPAPYAGQDEYKYAGYGPQEMQGPHPPVEASSTPVDRPRSELPS